MFTQIFLSGNKKSRFTGAFQPLWLPLQLVWHFLFGWRQGETTWQRKHSWSGLSLTNLARPDCCCDWEGYSDRFGVTGTTAWARSVGHPPRLFPHHWWAGGPGAEARGGLLAPQQSSWAVAGKGYGPLFSPSPPVVTNPAEREREREMDKEGKRYPRHIYGQGISPEYWVRGQLMCDERGLTVRW